MIMKLRTALLAIGVIFGLAVSASTAQAAKGVKKNASSTGTHLHHGKVTHVDHKNGHFTIVAHHQSSKKKVNTPTTATTRTHHFKVSGGTKFVAHHGQAHAPTSFAALRVGEHVTVASKKGTAETVVIHKSTKANRKKPKKLQ